MHHAHYKVTLELDNEKDGGEVFYVDHQHLHASDDLRLDQRVRFAQMSKGEVADDEDVYVATYYVADLVTPIAKPAFSDTGELRRVKNAKPDFETLLNLITTTIEPNSWDDLGGPGAIESFEGNLSLVVNNTPSVHDQVAELLAQLRALQRAQVELRSTILSIPDDVLRKLGLEEKLSSLVSQTEWLRIMEKVRQHPKARIYDQKKAHLFNGQVFTLQATKDQKIRMLPVVSSDRESVRLTLDMQGDMSVSAIGVEADAGLLLKMEDGKFRFISAHPHFVEPNPKREILGTTTNE
jgi:hypothetical protein